MSSLLRLYVIRGLIAILWAVGFATVRDSLAVGAITLLVVYPLIDAVALLFDFRDQSGMPGRGLQVFNIGVSTLAAIALAIAENIDVASVLLVFGGWAIVSGVAQLVAALHRRRPEMGKQWSLLLVPRKRGRLTRLRGPGGASRRCRRRRYNSGIGASSALRSPGCGCPAGTLHLDTGSGQGTSSPRH